MNFERLQVVVPKEQFFEVFKLLPNGKSGGHLGVRKTLEKVRERFYWVNCRDYVKDWCRKCTVCATANGPHKRRKAPLKK